MSAGSGDGQIDVPNTLRDLYATVKDLQVTCTCHSCKPREHGCSSHIVHKMIDDLEALRTPEPQGHLMPRGSFLAMATVEKVVEYIDREKDDFYPLQAEALQRLKIRMKQLDFLTLLASPKVDDHLDTIYIQHVLQDFNMLFFLGALRKINFHWVALPLNELADACTHGSWTSEIRMDPIKVFNAPLPGCTRPELNRLGIFLHEMVHVFEQQFICGRCHDHKDHIGKGGHGRIFQVIAKAIEDAAPRFLGLPLDLGRFPSLLKDLRDGGNWPSTCDLEKWDFPKADWDNERVWLYSGVRSCLV